MFGSLGDIAKLMKQAGQIQNNIAQMQETLAKTTYEGDAGAGLVKATVNGRGELVDIRIDPQALSDVELLEDLVKSAVAAAASKAQQEAKAELAKLTGGMNLPGIEHMLGG